MKVDENDLNGEVQCPNTHGRHVFRLGHGASGTVGDGDGFGEPIVGGILGGSCPGATRSGHSDICYSCARLSTWYE